MGKLGTTLFILNIGCAVGCLFSGNYPMMFVNGAVATMMWHSSRGL